MYALKNELVALLHRNDLTRAALTLGQIQDAAFDVEPYAEKVMSLSSSAWNLCSQHRKDPVFIAECIRRVLFDEFGLVGKSEKSKQVIDDPTRHYIHSVIDRKVGSSLSITVMYAMIAQQVGLEFDCIALPSYYLLKISDVAGDFYIDPFEGGRLLTSEEFQRRFRSTMTRNRMISTNLYEIITFRQLVARIAQQLKHVYILKGTALEALRCVEVLTVLFPESPELTRDRGILYCEMEYFSKAMEDLKSYLKQRPDAEDVGEIKKLTTMLKGYHEVMN